MRAQKYPWINKLPYLWVLERIYFVVKYDLLYLCIFGNCWTGGQTSHRAVYVGICLCFSRDTRIPTPTICRWVLPVGEHNSLPLGTPIKHLSSSHLKNPATATPLFPSPQIFLTPRFSECWVLCLSEAWNTDQIVLLAPTCFPEMLDSYWQSLSSILSSHW